jgi:hypothetical protein
MFRLDKGRKRRVRKSGVATLPLFACIRGERRVAYLLLVGLKEQELKKKE